MKAFGLHGSFCPAAEHAPGCRRLCSRSFHSAWPVSGQTSRTNRCNRRAVVEVCAAKGRKAQIRQQQASRPGQAPPTPPVDPDNAEFVIFVRAVKYPQWYPLSIVKGGSAANMLVKAMESDLGKKLSGNTLVRNIGTVVYKEREKIEEMVKTQMPLLKGFSDFQYGFKIRDKENPKDWYIPQDITIIPPQEELGETVMDKAKNFFSGGLFKGLGGQKS